MQEINNTVTEMKNSPDGISRRLLLHQSTAQGNTTSTLSSTMDYSWLSFYLVRPVTFYTDVHSFCPATHPFRTQCSFPTPPSPLPILFSGSYNLLLSPNVGMPHGPWSSSLHYLHLLSPTSSRFVAQDTIYSLTCLQSLHSNQTSYCAPVPSIQFRATVEGMSRSI